MDELKRYVNDDRFRVDGDKNMRLLAFAFTIVFVWTGPKLYTLRAESPSISLDTSRKIEGDSARRVFLSEYCD